ncbi:MULTISPECIES: VOC family protein [unclassified Chelatococcus]|uniref:VOC family protein n=1 Tax=unclassified Chelatococcus TaxID=2638111 RepID=UPI001BCE5300|nr:MULTISPECIES: VOC family protein [unclassified Chelatococcus]MBS7699378.1 VOC family protein [Chelatococcus sp. YT9]MBX3557730.1 VOC family protein [Chelatococcus sp.]
MPDKPKLGRILETALYVDDLDRAARFYRDVLGLAVLTSDSRFFAFDVGGANVLLLFKRGSTLETVTLPGGTIPPHDGHGPLHVAFAVTTADLGGWEERLAAAEIPIEGRTEWPKGGRSIYLRDPDGHLLEFATPGIWASY